MTLLLGCLLVYHFDLHWGWYLASVVVYCSEMDQQYRHRRALEQRIHELESNLMESGR